jgi:DNA topoisomerase-3
MRGFVSNRTRRKFSAFLVRKPDGTTGFEFEPRPAKTGAPAKRAVKTVNGEAEAAPVAKSSKTRVRAAVVAGATAVSQVKSKQARKVSSAVARKPVANTARTSSPRKPTARR